MKTPTPEETAAATNRGIFQGLAKILAMLATRMQTQEEAATQIARLVPRAEELAAQARALAVVRIPESGAAAELEAFTEETEKLAQRAAREAAVSRAAGAILKGQAAEPRAVARTLDGALAALPARLKAVKAVAANVASLGSSARDRSTAGCATSPTPPPRSAPAWRTTPNASVSPSETSVTGQPSLPHPERRRRVPRRPPSGGCRQSSRRARPRSAPHSRRVALSGADDAVRIHHRIHGICRGFLEGSHVHAAR